MPSQAVLFLVNWCGLHCSHAILKSIVTSLEREWAKYGLRLLLPVASCAVP